MFFAIRQVTNLSYFLFATPSIVNPRQILLDFRLGGKGYSRSFVPVARENRKPQMAYKRRTCKKGGTGILPVIHGRDLP